MNNILRLAALTVFSSLLPHSLPAQDLLDLMSPCTRVRIAAPELGFDAQVGELARTGECIHVRVPLGSGTILGVPLHRITSLEVGFSDGAVTPEARRRSISLDMLRLYYGRADQESTTSDGEEWIALDLSRVRTAHDRHCPEPPFRDAVPLVIGRGGAYDG